MDISVSRYAVKCDKHGTLLNGHDLQWADPQQVAAAVFEHKLIMHPRVHAREMREVGVGGS